MPRRRPSLAATVASLLAMCVSCRAPLELPHRAAPAGYPVHGRNELPGTFATIPEADIAKALEGRRYRVRWGVLRGVPGPDEPVDATTGRFGFPTEGPFEADVVIAARDVWLRVFPEEVSPEPAAVHRMIGCVDVRPSCVPAATADLVVMLDIQPLDDAPPMPFAIDAVTGERLSIDATKLLDGNNAPCDRRLLGRATWDDNLLRQHRR